MASGHPSSFRDPRGFLFEQDGVLYRQVNESGRPDYAALMESGLYAALTAKGLLVAHAEVDEPRAAAGAWRILKPDLVPFVSYPSEWSFGQLKSAALATLRIQRIALRHGMSLRDASAFNVQFIGARPVFIDTLSFERAVEGRPWVGYRQFCQHFLAPLYLRAGCDPRLSALSGSWIDGIPLDVARRLAARRYRLRPGFAVHISLHARAQERYKEAAAEPAAAPRLSSASLAALLDSLRSTIERLTWNPAGTQWADYYAKTNYTDAAMEEKRSFVAAVVDQARPGQVVDLGANTGQFAAVAGRLGAYVIAADMDHGAVELCFRAAAAQGGSRILPLVVDLACPTPAVGWMNTERASFLERCRGRTDLVLALALVHHLAIGNNVPLPRVVELLARIAPRAVVEFVDKRDSQVRRLLASREDIFDEYSEAGFEQALAGTFTVVQKVRICGAERTLYHLQRV
jgi:ribosomal protein L11 methylase PrmA